MATIDIRDFEEDKIDKIIFSSYGTLNKVVDAPHYMQLVDLNGDLAVIQFNDIETLYKAMLKAKELWNK